MMKFLLALSSNMQPDGSRRCLNSDNVAKIPDQKFRLNTFFSIYDNSGPFQLDLGKAN